MKNYIAFLALLCGQSWLCAAQAQPAVFKKIGNVTIYDIADKGVYKCTAGMHIDADGAPKAYHANDKIALDYLANAGKPGNWYGIVTNKGVPYIQTATDPAPGYYVSATALYDRSKKIQDPHRYADATAIPYIVIPGKFGSNDFKLGDLALVVNTANNKRCFAIAGDVGNSKEFGECSVYLAEQLGVPGSPKHGGAAGGIIYILIKNSGTGNGRLYPAAEIERMGKEKLSEEQIAALLK